MNELRFLPVDSLIRRSDVRAQDEAAVSALAESIADLGLLNPLTVRPVQGDRFEIIAGSHRFAACDMLDWREIACQVVDIDDVHAELAMIDENLCRAELSVAQRASQTARRQELYETLHGKAKALGANAANAAQGRSHDANDNLSFASSTAHATGRDVRSVQRDAARGSAIAPEAIERITGSHLDKGTYLDTIKRVPREEQAARVERDLAAPAAPRRALTPPPSPSHADAVAALLTALDGLNGMTSGAVLSQLQPRDRARVCQRVSSAIDLLFEIQEGAQQ